MSKLSIAQALAAIRTLGVSAKHLPDTNEIKVNYPLGHPSRTPDTGAYFDLGHTSESKQAAFADAIASAPSYASKVQHND